MSLRLTQKSINTRLCIFRVKRESTHAHLHMSGEYKTSAARSCSGRASSETGRRCSPGRDCTGLGRDCPGPAAHRHRAAPDAVPGRSRAVPDRSRAGRCQRQEPRRTPSQAGAEASSCRSGAATHCPCRSTPPPGSLRRTRDLSTSIGRPRRCRLI